MRRRISLFENIDWLIIGLYLILLAFGWVNIYSAEYNGEQQSTFDFSQRYGKQLLWIIAAIILAFLVMIIDSRFYGFFAFIIYGISILLLLFVLVFGEEVHGSRSWFSIGAFNLQPAEFAKVATALALSRLLSMHNFKLSTDKNLVIATGIIFFPAILIMLQPDAGTVLIYFSFIIVLYRSGLSNIYLLLLLITGVLFMLSIIVFKLYLLIGLVILAFLSYFLLSKNVKNTFKGFFLLIIVTSIAVGIKILTSWEASYYTIILFSLIISASFILILSFINKITYIKTIVLFLAVSVFITFSVDYVFNNVLKEHQQKRINILLGLESDPLGVGYNVNQSKIAIGSGGFSGKGFLNGTQTKFHFVPEQTTDFIFCTVGEEWGFIGTTIVVLLFSVFFLRLSIMAERQRDPFSKIFGYCVLSILFFHFLVNIGMTIGLLPVIGIPLPFFSYGGSSLWAFTILLFIFIKLDAIRKEKFV